MAPNPKAAFLSSLTARVVRLLAREDWLTREEIAARLGENPEGNIRAFLTDLAERNWLEAATRKGYHINIPDDADPDEYRKRLLDWLDRHYPESATQ